MSDPLDKIDLRKASDEQLALMLLTIAGSMATAGADVSMLIGVLREAARRFGAPPLPSKENQE